MDGREEAVEAQEQEGDDAPPAQDEQEAREVGGRDVEVEARSGEDVDSAEEGSPGSASPSHDEEGDAGDRDDDAERDEADNGEGEATEPSGELSWNARLRWPELEAFYFCSVCGQTDFWGFVSRIQQRKTKGRSKIWRA